MRPSERPRIEIVPTTLDQVLDRFSLAGVLFIVVLLAAVWDRLPARVPTHFGMSGTPNAWGTRNSLLLFAILPLVMHVGLTILSRVPWTYNYPTKVTEENAARLYALGRGMMLWLRTEIVWLFALLGWQTIQVATGQATALGPPLIFPALGIIYGTVIYYLVLMYRARRQPSTPGGN